jgi:hypothetical protein
MGTSKTFHSLMAAGEVSTKLDDSKVVETVAQV